MNQWIVMAGTRDASGFPLFWDGWDWNVRSLAMRFGNNPPRVSEELRSRWGENVTVVLVNAPYVIVMEDGEVTNVAEIDRLRQIGCLLCCFSCSDEKKIVFHDSGERG